MELSSLYDFSATGIDGDFGILDIMIANSSNNSNKTTASSNDANNTKY